MRRESRLGRILWIAIVLLLGGYVVADFVRSPFLAPNGSAAVRGAAVTLWTPAGESGGETGAVLEGTAAALELQGHGTAVKSLRGGTAQALIGFFSGTSRAQRGDLLVVTSTTIADLAHDARDRLVPGASEQAALARVLLRRSQPIGMLESDPLSIAVSPRSPLRTGHQLLESLAAYPFDQSFAIGDETFSRDQLAALVYGAGVDGEVHFSVFQDGSQASTALETGGADAVLATRGELREDAAAGRLRELGWPIDGGRAPRAWVGLVARPDLPRRRLDRLRRCFASLARDREWAAHLRADGRAPARPGVRTLAGLIGDSAGADRRERLTALVERH
jgi:hypothetical protein